MTVRSKGKPNILPQLRKALAGLDSLPNVREVVLDRAFSNGTHNTGFSVKHYDPPRQALRVTIHATNGIGQHVYVKTDRKYAEDLRLEIERMNSRRDEYFHGR